MEKLTTLPTQEELETTYKDQVLYIAKPDENVIVTNNGEWMPVTKHTSELAGKTAEIEALKTQIESTSTELKTLKKEFKDIDGFKEKVEKLEAEKTETLKKLEDAQKLFTIKEAVKDSYRELGVQPKYIDFVVSKEHPELDKVELKDGKFVIDEEKTKTLKETYKEVIGEIKTAGWTPAKGDSDDKDKDKPKGFLDEFKDSFH